MRLFFAVAADEAVKEAAAGVVERLRRVPGDYRWVDPRDMHVTLRYLGETPEERVPEMRAILERAAADTLPFEMVYGRLGAFDSLDDPRVVWIGVEQGVDALALLAARLKRAQPRPFAPHLTIGRRRRAPAPPEFLAALRAEPPLALRRRVDRLSLYASRPADFGHVYEIVADAALAGS